jgi:DNA-directed RNA polymerase subunit RPC12/RpoP
MTVLLLALAIPTALWLSGRAAARSGSRRPPLAGATALGAVALPALVPLYRRSFLEEVGAWVVALVGWGGLLVGGDAEVLAASALVGGAWGFILAMPSLGAATERANPTGDAAPPPPPPAERTSLETPAEEHGFKIELPCPECGAAVPFPVYHRMTTCPYCGSRHLVNRGSETLSAVIPDTILSADDAAAAVVKHLRHRRYLELYDRRVRPLVERHAASSSAQGDGMRELAAGAGVSPTQEIINAAEEAVNRAADDFAARLRPHVRPVGWQRFLSPYRHRGGTLYQVAFGRDHEANKRMELSITYQEASLPAADAPLREMGKLSYLRALRPLLGAPEASQPRLPVAVPAEELVRRMKSLEHRATDLPITVIASRGTFVPDVEAVVWRPWHNVEVEVEGERHSYLLDGGAGAVAGKAVAAPSAVEAEPVPDSMSLSPSRCPDCGADLPYVPDALAHLCCNCYRLIEEGEGRWRSLPYRCEEPAAAHWSAPFWLFPLRLRTGEGRLVTDLRHLGDGIDGTFDQVGDAPQGQSLLFVPAFRLRLSKASVTFYRQLWPLLYVKSAQFRPDRFTPSSSPEHAVPVTIHHGEARVFALSLLALTFTSRDLARAEIRGVRARFLDCELEGEPELVFRTLPAELFAPYRAVLAPTLPPAIAAMEGRPLR